MCKCHNTITAAIKYAVLCLEIIRFINGIIKLK